MPTTKALPKRWDRIAKATTRNLIRAETASLRSTRAAVDAAVTQALSGLSPDATEQEATLAARRAAQAVLAAMVAAVMSVRAAGRAVGDAQVAAEAAEISTVWGSPIRAPRPLPDRDGDAAAAEAAGASYAAAWLALATVVIIQRARAQRADRRRQAAAASAASAPGASSRVQGVAAEVAKVTSRLDHRVERVVVTETYRSRTAAHNAGVAAMVKAHPGAPWEDKAFRRWDARLDRIVCNICRGHESEETGIDGQFRQEHEPGDVHPHCRCIATAIVMPLGRDEVSGLNATSPAPYLVGSGEL